MSGALPLPRQSRTPSRSRRYGAQATSRSIVRCMVVHVGRWTLSGAGQDVVRENLVTREGFDKKIAVAVRCYNDELMTREQARELFYLIIEEYGVPKARFISPTLDGAALLFDAAEEAGKPEALTVDNACTGAPWRSLEQYLGALGY